MEIQVARHIDLAHVVEALRELGHEPEVRGLEVRVSCEDEGGLCAGLVADLEAWVAAEGIPLVPERDETHVYLRPPSG